MMPQSPLLRRSGALQSTFSTVTSIDSIASSVRTALKKCQSSLSDTPHNVFGYDCVAANVVLAFSKLRYKDSKGDPRGCKIFLRDEGLPMSVIPRYRGNRLHVLFHICGVLMCHYEKFIKLLQSGPDCGGLRPKLLMDFRNNIVVTQLHVIGLLGKIIFGPWMRKFYCSASDQVTYVEGISLVADVILRLQSLKPKDFLVLQNDCFGDPLPLEDRVLKTVQRNPQDPALFEQFPQSSIDAIVCLLERQYKRQFDTPVSEDETLSARTHNMNAEEVCFISQ